MRTNKFYRMISVFLATLLFVVIINPGRDISAAETVDLGSTVNFAVLAATTVTNTGTTVIDGDAGSDVGVYPGTSITGFPPGVIVFPGTIHEADALAEQAQTDLTAAYNDAAGRQFTLDLSGQDLGGLTLTPGVYKFDSSAQLTGMLTLDAQGNPDAAFIFQIASTLTTASASSVVLIDGAQYCRVFWQVGSSATLGTESQFIGHIFALASITLTTDASVQGQLLALTGAVTLDSNTITNGVCAAPTLTPAISPTPTLVPTISPAPTLIPTTSTTPTLTPATSLTPTPTISIDDQTPQPGDTRSYRLIGLLLLSLSGFLALYLRRFKSN